MYSTDAGISKFSRSVRRNMYPVFSGAGLSCRLTGTPVCSPVPVVCTLFARVVCLIDREVSNSGAARINGTKLQYLPPQHPLKLHITLRSVAPPPHQCVRFTIRRRTSYNRVY